MFTPQAYRDSVNEVRVGASEALQRLCKVCGADWLQEKVLPRIHGFYDESSFYLIRIAILNALKKLANGEVSDDGEDSPGKRCGGVDEVLNTLAKGKMTKIISLR